MIDQQMRSTLLAVYASMLMHDVLVLLICSVMLNWEMEFKKWCPAFKLLTYYGTAKERKQKRQGWSKPHAFHVCITSYTLVLQDAKVGAVAASNRHPSWYWTLLQAPIFV